jgi:trk system potassium uptake protein TrkA
MYVVVVGGGKVGYYLTKSLLAEGYEVVLTEKERARSNELSDE